jgi:hypothetical protein
MYLREDSIYGFICTKNEEVWGDFRRSLDWGDWEPAQLYAFLPDANTSRKMCDAATNQDQTGFVREYRSLNEGSSMEEARKAYEAMRTQLRMLEQVRGG